MGLAHKQALYEEEEENLFAKKLVARKGFSPSTLANIHTNKNRPNIRKHKHYMPKQLNQCQVSSTLLDFYLCIGLELYISANKCKENKEMMSMYCIS